MVVLIPTSWVAEDQPNSRVAPVDNRQEAPVDQALHRGRLLLEAVSIPTNKVVLSLPILCHKWEEEVRLGRLLH